MTGVFNYTKSLSAATSAFGVLYATVNADSVVTGNEWIYVAVGTTIITFLVWLLPNLDVKALLAQLVDNAAKAKQAPPLVMVNAPAVPSNTASVAPGKVVVPNSDWLPDYTD